MYVAHVSSERGVPLEREVFERKVNSLMVTRDFEGKVYIKKEQAFGVKIVEDYIHEVDGAFNSDDVMTLIFKLWQLSSKLSHMTGKYTSWLRFIIESFDSLSNLSYLWHSYLLLQTFFRGSWADFFMHIAYIIVFEIVKEVIKKVLRRFTRVVLNSGPE